MTAPTPRTELGIDVVSRFVCSGLDEVNRSTNPFARRSHGSTQEDVRPST